MTTDLPTLASRNVRPHRACLAVPGSNPRMLAKAAGLGPDQVIIDLEDAVLESDKVAARQTVIEALRSHDFGRSVVSLRVNGLDTRWCYRDIVEVVEAAGDRLASIVVPKIERAHDVAFVARLLDQIELAKGLARAAISLEVQIESAPGLVAVDEIARSSPRVDALILGPGDLAANLGMSQLTIGADAAEYPGDIWHYARVRLLVAARAASLLALDGPYAVIADLQGLESTARRAAALGFDGKWVIHPSQIETVTRAFSPDPLVYARAERLLAAYHAATDRGAFRFEGEMIDEATRKMAESVVRRGRWLGLAS